MADVMARTTPAVRVDATAAVVPAHAALALATVAAATAPVTVQLATVPVAPAATVQHTTTPAAVTVDIAVMAALVQVVLELSLTQLTHHRTSNQLSLLHQLLLLPMHLVPRPVTTAILHQHASVSLCLLMPSCTSTVSSLRLLTSPSAPS